MSATVLVPVINHFGDYVSYIPGIAFRTIACSVKTDIYSYKVIVVGIQSVVR